MGSVPLERVKVVFIGILLSKHDNRVHRGKGASSERNNPSPSWVSEVRSFLGLVGFSSIFISDLRPRQNFLEYSVESQASTYLWFP